MSTPRAELSGADDVNKRREGRETQKSSFLSWESSSSGSPSPPSRLVDVISAGKLGSSGGLSVKKADYLQPFSQG